MSRPTSSSAALPIAYLALRILIVLNWLMGAAILALLVVSPNEQWIMAAFKLSPSPDTDRLIMGLRAIAVLGLAGIPLTMSSSSGWSRLLRRFARATLSSSPTHPVCRQSPGRCSRCSF